MANQHLNLNLLQFYHVKAANHLEVQPVHLCAQT